MTVRSLLGLSPKQICSGAFPLRSLLKDSLYYPACDIDGELIRYCNRHFDQLGICSFVYVDYAAGRERLMDNLDTFLGYHLLAARELSSTDVGADKHFQISGDIDHEEYGKYHDCWQPFGQWAVYERDEGFGADHGPVRFSLLYLGAEGVAAYSGLYLSNKITPKGLAIIQPGHGFGLNWTDFTDPDGPFSGTLRMGTSLPEYIFYGGLGFHGYNVLPWAGYKRIDRVDHYYPTFFESAMTVWQGTIVSLEVYKGGLTLQVMDNPRTKPHGHVNRVFVEYEGRPYEAECGTYHNGDTLRGEEIRELITRNNWQPGYLFSSQFIRVGNTHVYRIIK